MTVTITELTGMIYEAATVPATVLRANRLFQEWARPQGADSTLANAAVALRIAETTAKTHLTDIFARTGVSHQAELIALVHRLAHPSQGRNDDQH